MSKATERAVELHRTMTPHQMALQIVELQDALELAEEAVRAKQQAVPEGWQLVPVEPTVDMLEATCERGNYARNVWEAMLAAAPKLEGGAA